MPRQTRPLLCIGIMALAAQVAAAGVVAIDPGDFLPGESVITFETGTTGLPNVPGVTLLDKGFGDPDTWFGGTATFFDSFFGSQVYTNLVSGSFSHLGIVFDDPVPAVGAWFGRINNFLNDDAETLLLRALDDGGSLIWEQAFATPPMGSPQWVGILSDGGIKRFEWKWSEPGFFGVDNITFGDAIPEPSALLLLVAGALGLRRRR